MFRGLGCRVFHSETLSSRFLRICIFTEYMNLVLSVFGLWRLIVGLEKAFQTGNDFEGSENLSEPWPSGLQGDGLHIVGSDI